MGVYIFILLLVLTVIVFPLHFHIRGEFDAYTNVGVVKGYFFVFRIFRLHLKYYTDEYSKHAVFVLNPKTGKIARQINLTIDKGDKNSIVNLLVQPILGSINITDIEMYAKIGVAKDAFLSAMSLAVLQSLYGSLLAVVHSMQRLETYERFVPVYNKNIFEVKFLGVFTFTVADVLFGLWLQLCKRKKTGD